MIQHNPNPQRPSPEDLARLVDGELNAEQCREIDTWLAKHPEAAAEVEAQRRLTRLWQETSAPEPSAGAWNGALSRVESRLQQAVSRSARGRHWVWMALGSAAAAAVVLLALRFGRTPAPEDGIPLADDSPLAVATADEVEIISMDDADRPALVVGEPPIQEPLALLGPGEVEVNTVKQDEFGRLPRIDTRDRSAAPMIILTAAGGVDDPSRK